jgi:hypothetical protein
VSRAISSGRLVSASRHVVIASSVIDALRRVGFADAWRVGVEARLIGIVVER